MTKTTARRPSRRRASVELTEYLEDHGYTVVRLKAGQWALLGPGGQPLKVDGRRTSTTQYAALVEAVRRIEAEHFDR